jgi:glycogen(starch) synthase
MRILRVAQKTYPEATGGGAYHVHAMSRDQAALGHDVTVLTVGEYGEQEREGYDLISRPATTEILGNEISIGVGRYLRRHADRFDFVHAHSHLYFSTNLAALVRRFGGPPVAVTNHGLYSQTAPERLFNLYLRTLGRWTFNTSDIAFCYTDEDRKRLRDIGVSTRIEVVHNGIDTTRFTPEGPSDNRIIGDPSILFVGRLVDGKRPNDALEAFVKAREQLPDAGLTFCGDGPLRPELEDAARDHAIENKVRFIGQVDYEVMPRVYRAADILILPSRAEGLPRTVLEAMATNVPVVVSDLDQIASLVEMGGKTVPVGDAGSFAEQLVSVLNSAEKYSPRGQIMDSYSWKETVEQTTNHLKSL